MTSPEQRNAELAGMQYTGGSADITQRRDSGVGCASCYSADPLRSRFWFWPPMERKYFFFNLYEFPMADDPVDFA
jgi:hypothetical protein